MDLKKVPTMEFALLSLIAANGATGITQPELTQYSGQDKRSVPHRTDELARKGYIVKKPVQAGKARTSLCVHSKFVSHDHFTSSGAMEDVFQEGQFVASGFALLLYEAFKDAGVILTRDIRKRLVSFTPRHIILLIYLRVSQCELGTNELYKALLYASTRLA
jgi:transcription factor C subunit 3